MYYIDLEVVAEGEGYSVFVEGHAFGVFEHIEHAYVAAYGHFACDTNAKEGLVVGIIEDPVLC